jgi:hypothetical protein
LLAGLVLGLLSAAPSRAAAPEIFLREEPEAYLVIDKLQGLGHLPGLMAGDRGLEAEEVALEAEKAGWTDEPFVDGMLRYLQVGRERKSDFRLRLGVEHSDDGVVVPNDQGWTVPRDGGVRAGGFFRTALSERFSLQGRAELQADADGELVGRVEETSIRAGWPQATLEAGRFSLWWGPGRHGSMIFTTNAEPLTGLRFRNPRPIALGSWFRFLGLFQYDLFAARLGRDRPVPHSFLAGLRLSVKPNPWLELGASRVLHFGGEGRSVSFSKVLDIFQGRSESPENTPEGNSMASLDLKLLLPFRRQPVTVYAEGGAEDQSGSGIPSRWGGMAGIFLPSIGTIRRADLRIEYADNDRFISVPGVWYLHGSYPHIVRGRVLGHHMGTDARDLFVEAHFFLAPSSYLEVNLDLTERSFPGPAIEEEQRWTAAIVGWLSRSLRAEARLAFARVSNAGGIAGDDSRDASLQATLAYQPR